MGAAVIVAMVLTVVLPDDLRAGPVWLLPSLAGLPVAAPLTSSVRPETLDDLAIGARIVQLHRADD